MAFREFDKEKYIEFFCEDVLKEILDRDRLKQKKENKNDTK